jgi:dUTP pyrophosphatase
MKLNVLKLDKTLPDLQYAKAGDVAFDLRSVEDDYTLKPMEHKIFKTGIAMELPEKHVGNIRDRSGMAGKYAIHVMGGIIDPGYRGEIGIVLINLSGKDFVVEKHMRIAQMLIQPVEIVTFENVDTLSETERGEGSFGSTGKK